MTNLFIIGNGFDIAHNMNTRYLHFRQYLIDKYEITEDIIDNIWCDIPCPTTYPDGGEVYDNTSAGAAIIRILDNAERDKNWKDVETSLGKLPYGDFLDDWSDYNNPDNDKAFFDNIYRNEDNARNLCGALKLICDYFQDWIKTVKMSKSCLTDFQNLISPENDLFLNFNYTKTLEELYGAKNVCHIHGTKDDEIFFGHGNNEDKTSSFQSNWFGADSELNQFELELRKNTHGAYQKNANFFSQIIKATNTDGFKIYSYGFSFSEVDKYYLEIIFRNINTKNTTFYLNDYDSTEIRDRFIKIIKACGFKGSFLTYHIDSKKLKTKI